MPSRASWLSIRERFQGDDPRPIKPEDTGPQCALNVIDLLDRSIIWPAGFFGSSEREL